ncbi:MAG: acyl-CoA thioesterase/BAAT N-terminal domain-containing protein [Gemmatimonadota bacterium]|nr:MAG: acyl-CoA thioesterase/BAAT N-terminal domain-containing protein [Gemmatimonadota bacterium]
MVLHPIPVLAAALAIPILGLAVPLEAQPFSQQPVIRLSATEILIDEPLEITVSGLPPGSRVLLRMMAWSQLGTWTSSAEFAAGRDGTVDLDSDAPIAGTYEGADSMGLFWSAVPDSTAATESAVPPNTERVRLIAELEGEPVAEATLTRQVIRPGVQVLPIRTDALIATFFLPSPAAGSGPYPGVLVLGGSECGLQSAEAHAAALASHGFAALALAYCAWPDESGRPLSGMEALPQGLWMVPLEAVERGLEWLRARSEIDAERIGVWGASKGAELALLLASANPIVRAVVAYSPSHVVWQGLDFRGERRSSWSRDGYPVPFVPFTQDEARIRDYTRGGPRYITHLYRASLDDEAAVAEALIPVERINGPVLMVSGGNDLLWPSTLMAERIVDRLEGSGGRATHLYYEGAGHAIGRPFRPTTGLSATPNFALGGDAAAYAAAERDSWPRVLRFLRESLAGRGPL